MRQAVKQLSPTGNDKPAELSAQVVHIPSTRVRLVEQVPVAIRDDGTATVLRAPNNTAALKDIEGWAARQPVPNQGVVATALVTIHPLPQAQPPQASTPISRLPEAARPAAAPAGGAPAQRSSYPEPPPLPVEGPSLTP
jgi:hypothetical protein